jgi:hypothetical protein
MEGMLVSDDVVSARQQKGMTCTLQLTNRA